MKRIKAWLKVKYPVAVGFLVILIAGLFYGYASLLYGNGKRVTRNATVIAAVAAVIGLAGLIVLILYERNRMRNLRVRDLTEDSENQE